MRAIYYERYGTPEVLTLKDVGMPVPSDHEIIIEVRAASINSWDWDMVRGEPFFVRMWGLFKPRFKIPGADIAGVVSKVGRKVTRWKVGDEVFGDLCENGWGGYAMYACAKEDAVVAKPKELSFEEAAALPQAGLLALQSFKMGGDIGSGQTVLVNGAGGVGTFAVQLARMYGATVAGIDRSEKLEQVKALGATHVFDYHDYDFPSAAPRYDLIIDMVANRTISAYKRCLNPGGKFLMVGGTSSSILQIMAFGPLASARGNKTVAIMPYQANRHLDELAKLVVDGKIKPVIGKVYPLEQTREAFRHFGTGRFVGKLVIRITG